MTKKITKPFLEWLDANIFRKFIIWLENPFNYKKALDKNIKGNIMYEIIMSTREYEPEFDWIRYFEENLSDTFDAEHPDYKWVSYFDYKNQK